MRIRTPRSAGLLLVALSLSAFDPLSFGGGGSLAAQAVVCDPALAQRSTDPQGYRLRGDRCEGVYAQPVAGTTLLVASFTGSFADYDIHATRDLVIRWPASAQGGVHLRALGLRRKLYYRMDTMQPASTEVWTWPADLLTSLDISRAELGIVGWTRRRIGDVERDVFLPLRVGATVRATGRYLLVLLPQVALTEVYVSVAAVGADGRPATWLRDDEPLGYNYYPADRPIEIPIDRPDRPGIYYVLIGAALSGGASLTTELWFEVPHD